MKPEDMMAVLHDMGLTEGQTWTRSALTAHLHNAPTVQVEEIREPTEPGGFLTIILTWRAEGARFALSFEPLGNDRYSFSTGSTSETLT